MKKIFLLALSAFIILGCSPGREGNPINTVNNNITILIDLSDRINPGIHPGQSEKDIEAIKSILKSFGEKLSCKGTFKTNDKIKVVFYPQNIGSGLTEIAESLSINFGKMTNPEKKKAFANMEQRFYSNLKRLYEIIIKEKKYCGSDIYNYFEQRLEDDCIETRPDFKNQLVIITDGYLYWHNYLRNSGNRYTYVLPSSDHIKKFRISDWESSFDNGDYGFIPCTKDLSNLKILLLELNPTESSPGDYDILKKYWTKWFLEMNAAKENIKISRTDMPAQTRAIIEKYL